MKWLKRSPNDNHLPYSSSQGNTVRGACGRRVYECNVKDSWSQLLLEIMSDMLVPAMLDSQQLRFRVDQTVPCQIWNSIQAMGDYVMSRRCNGGHPEFCSLVSRLYDRESGNKKLNGYAMTWDDSSNIGYNVTHILKFQNESI